MRPALRALLLALLLVPTGARGVLVVDGGGAVRVEEVVALVGGDDVSAHVAVQARLNGLRVGSAVGAILPLPGRPTEVDYADSMDLVELQTATEPLIVRAPPAGCGDGRNLVPMPPPNRERGVISTQVTDFDTVSPEERDAVEAWAGRLGLQLDADARRVISEAQAEGRWLALYALEPRDVRGFTPILHAEHPGPPQLPLPAFAPSASAPLRLTVFVAGDTAAAPQGYPALTLHELDADLVRTSVSLEVALQVTSLEHGGRLFLIELAQPYGQVGFWGDVPGFYSGSYLTRMRALIQPALLEPELVPVFDPGAPEVEPVLDLSPDPLAHGSGVGGGALLVALALAAIRRAGARRRRS